MAHSTSTNFPDSVDTRRFFSDVSLPHGEILEGYNDLIKQQKYQEASQYLYNNVEVPNVNMDYNGSYLWNKIDNQLVAIENYATTMDSTEVRPHYDTVAPTQTWSNMTWIA